MKFLAHKDYTEVLGAKNKLYHKYNEVIALYTQYVSEDAVLNEQLKEASKKTEWVCPACNGHVPVVDVMVFDQNFYVEPHGCTGGDYLSYDETVIVCPKCEVRFRFLRTLHSRSQQSREELKEEIRRWIYRYFPARPVGIRDTNLKAKFPRHCNVQMEKNDNDKLEIIRIK